jgi:hypothetical protein
MTWDIDEIHESQSARHVCIEIIEIKQRPVRREKRK